MKKAVFSWTLCIKIEAIIFSRIIFSIDLLLNTCICAEMEALTYKNSKVPLHRALKEFGKLVKYISKGNI